MLRLSVMCLWLCASMAHAADDAKFAKWEKEIAAFEAADQKQPPPKGGIVFVGSSSVRLWDVKKAFPNLPVINRAVEKGVRV